MRWKLQKRQRWTKTLFLRPVDVSLGRGHVVAVKTLIHSCLPTLRGEAFQSGQQQTPKIFTTLNPPALFFFFLPSIERHVFLQRAILFKIMSVK